MASPPKGSAAGIRSQVNQLVAAVDSFANEYNEGKGTIWPQREADKLRKAMRQLQSFEKALQDDTKAAAQQDRK